MAAAQEVLLKQIELEQATLPDYELDPEKSYEIVNGLPEEKEVPSARHGGVAARLTVELGIYLKSNNLGELYSEASFTIGQSAAEVTIFPEESELASEDLLTGFRCRLSDVFKTPAKSQAK